MLSGPLPNGPYHFRASGTQNQPGAHLHADVVVRAQDGTEQTVASADSNVASGDGGAPDSMDVVVQCGEVAAACGDLLFLRLKFVDGASDFLELQVHLTIP